MGPSRGSLLAALLCVVHLTSAGQVDIDPFDSPLRCVTPPAWSSGGASSLEQMRLALIEDGLDDINFLVVNSGGWMSRVLSYGLRDRVSFPVYEEGYFTSIWVTLNGAKDDILVYDRCGFLTYHLRMPYSFLSYPYVEGAIRVTYHGDDPCDCNLPEKANVTTPSTVENTNGPMERNATMGVNTEVENNTVIEHVVDSSLNKTTDMSDEVDVVHGVEEVPDKRDNQTKIQENAHKEKHRHLAKHHRHHDENYPRVK